MSNELPDSSYEHNFIGVYKVKGQIYSDTFRFIDHELYWYNPVDDDFQKEDVSSWETDANIKYFLTGDLLPPDKPLMKKYHGCSEYHMFSNNDSEICKECIRK